MSEIIKIVERCEKLLKIVGKCGLGLAPSGDTTTPHHPTICHRQSANIHVSRFKKL
jgi:hypothetical protein